MAWSTQAAVVSGGQLQLPSTGTQQSNIARVAALPGGTNQVLMQVSGPGLQVTNHAAWMMHQFWSDSPSGTPGGNAGNGGAHLDIIYTNSAGTALTVAQFDISGLLLPSVGAPATPTNACYIFYNSGVLFAKGASGTAVALATT